MQLPRLAVVEDDHEFRDGVLVPVLAHSGFQADGMGSALELYRAMTSHHYGLVLLDAGLPDEDGFSIAAHLRGLSQTVGIVMLTGQVSASDRLRGLQAGVDAYLAKPTSMEVVVTTLLNLARRVAPSAGPVRGKWRLGEGGWRITAPNGVEISLTLAERQVMKLLAGKRGVPARREALIANLADNVHDFDPHRLEMLIYRLRKKCQQAAQEELPLRAIRGIGYVLTW
ncbi:response regulator transcription factor [Luteimonas sp. RD2P54]|uniref:Response regulator transcription factor n=1 Tax=Luteimonas endophytica TaxID=3042023 RepID=A0ABT6JCJ6_9GAMM|nr:response regulator transcription factor [Luteimonas endophytica]MDH5823898.1 response regulator transcription factor [Luteimonas endophytica]